MAVSLRQEIEKILKDTGIDFNSVNSSCDAPVPCPTTDACYKCIVDRICEAIGKTAMDAPILHYEKEAYWQKELGK